MIRIEINNNEVDLWSDPITLTKQAYNFDDLASRNLSFTRQFKLPKTQKNISIFKNPDAIASTNDSFDKLYKAKIVSNTFLFNGVAILEDSSDSYSIQIIDASKELFNNLEQKINLIDTIDDYDFTFNLTNYGTLKTATDNIFIWPVLNNHNSRLTTNTILNTTGNDGLKYSRPCFNVRKLVDLAITNNNWSSNLADVYNDNSLEFLVIPSNTNDFYITSYQKTINSSLTLSGEVNLTGLNTNDFENDVTTTSTTIEIGTNTTRFRFRGNITTVADATIRFYGITNDTTPAELDQSFFIPAGTTYIDITTDEFKIDDGTTNTIQVFIDGTNDFDFVDTLLYTIIAESSFADLSTNPLLNFRVKAFDNLPDLKQIDLLRYTWIQSGLYFIIDSYSSIINFYLFNSISKIGALDWSNKYIIDTKTIKGKYASYAQKNILKYSNDDFVDETLGEYSFLIDSEILEKENTAIESSFSASFDTVIDSVDMATIEIYNDTGRIIEPETRILHCYIPATKTIYYAKFEPLKFSNISTNYYQTLFNSFNRLRVVTAYFDLNNYDILEFDFLKPVYIDTLQATFYVLQIKSYIENELTEVDLLKIY